ncbi:hypothetical protein ACFVWR_04015 [Leifsonia sp. NPDC058292]|uniref:hypothetical protein n=1 Tax=Leifsonia sp. NPDC058292 TaxID=3346428 RepID=UPI0036DC9E23
MDPESWVWLFVVAVSVWWPVILVVALLIVGPLVGAVIVAIVGTITRSVRGRRDEDDAQDEQAADAYPELFGTLAP